MPLHTDPTKRHDFVFLFEVTNGNPNGDPDAGNLPRVDPETMHGLVTDVSIKRKIRDFVDLQYGAGREAGPQTGQRIFIQSKVALNTLIGESRVANSEESANNSSTSQAAAGSTPKTDKAEKAAKKAAKEIKREQEDERRLWMCNNFYDVRTFGAVMSTGDYSAGQVRGPVQLTFARSIDPIVPLDLAITRVAITREEDDKRTEMGRKAVLPYALFRGQGFFTPHFARQTAFQETDLALFWEALQRCWELDRSASRGMLALRGLYIFTHENPLGNAPAHALFDRITIPSVTTARSFADYQVAVDEAELPAGVTLTTLVASALARVR